MKTTKAALMNGAILLAVGVSGCATSGNLGIGKFQRSSLSSTTVPTATITDVRPDFETRSANNYAAQKIPVSENVVTNMQYGDDFSELVRRAPGVVLVDFYADWCGPCRVQSEILDEVESTAAQHQATIIKINIDHHRELADQFGVSGLPTLMLLNNDGQIVDRKSGITDHQTVSAMLMQ